MTDTNTNALTTIIGALRALTPEDRHRTVEAAMVFLGETLKVAPAERKAGGAGKGAGDGSYPDATKTWMQDNGVSNEEMDGVFHFNDDGGFDIHDVPGKSKKEKTLNTYILAGLGNFLATSKRVFDDSMARKFCEKIGCYDAANHSVHMKKNKGGEFSGDKKRGFTLTNGGMRRGAALVKELAGTAK